MPIGAMSFCLSHRYGPPGVATALAYEHRLRQPLSPAEALTYIKRLESIAFFGLYTLWRHPYGSGLLPAAQ